MFHGDRFGACGNPPARPACELGIAGLRRWAVAPDRAPGAPILFLGARAACLILDRACLSRTVAAPVDGTAALVPAVARFVVAFGLATLRLVVFRCASA